MKFAPKSLSDYSLLSNIRISPDGKQLLYQISALHVEENDYTSAIHIRDLEKKEDFRLTASDKDHGALWESDDTILFSSGRDSKDKKHPVTDYYRIRKDGGEAVRAFSVPLAVSQIEPLGDGEWLLLGEYDPDWKDFPAEKDKQSEFIAEQEKEKGWKVLEDLPFWINGRGYTGKKQTRLYRYSEFDQSLEPLTDLSVDVESLHIHPDKTRAVFIESRIETVRNLDSQLSVLNLETDKIKTYDPLPGGAVYFAEFSGDSIFFLGTLRKTHGLNEDPHVYLMNPKGESRRITDDTFEMSPGSSVNSDLRKGGGFRMRTDGEDLYFIATVEQHAHVYKMAKDGTLAPVITRPGSVDALDVKDGKVYTIGLHDMRAQELYDANERLTSHNENVPEPQPVETFRFVSRGTERTGFVISPKKKMKDKKTPAILLIHGGPKTVYGEVLHHEMQLLAKEGYYVFYTNPHGSDGYGRSFMDVRGQYGSIDYDDLMQLTDAFLEQFPDADSERLGVMGGSYGGWMTNWIIGHTDRFKAACSQRSISNWISFFGNSDIGYYFTPDQAGADPWTDADKLWNNSPLKYADQVKTPTLFLHSDEDYRCWLPEGLQMYTALKYHGVPARMVVFHGENHELSRSGKPRARIKRLEEILAWFSEHLMK